jgi:acyl-CoA reductase-like NAD-dependent aldehyde dehydrogenase
MARVVNSKHFGRLTSLLTSTKGTFVLSGPSDASKLFIPPTVLTDLKLTDPLLASETFGPILSVLSYPTGQLASVPETVAQIDRTPLALYVFTEDMTEAEYIRSRTWSGGMCTNDVMGHVAITSLAFGGFGSSGMGSYRGKAGVDTFSHRRSTAIVPTTKDFEGLLEWRYADGDLDEKYKIFKTNLEGKLED